MKIPLHYIVLAVVFGVVISIGMMSLLYRPLPVQVSVNQYTPVKTVPTFEPAAPPQPAITTVPVPTGTGKFDPAPAPVIIPTATPDPGPTILRDPGPAGKCGSVIPMAQNAVSLGWVLGAFAIVLSAWVQARDAPTVDIVVVLITGAVWYFTYPLVTNLMFQMILQVCW